MNEQKEICTVPGCGEEIPNKRWDLGYRTCLKHGDGKKEFTVGIPYNKGGYQLIPQDAVRDMGRK